MQIDGHNNRVAGRDYYEKATLKLTPEQLAQLSIKPCVSCETRFVPAGTSTCNHCRREAIAQENHNKLSIFTFAVMVIWGLLLTQANKNGVHVTPSYLFQLGLASAAIVAATVVFCSLIRAIWIDAGDDIIKALGQSLIRLFKL
ncbi:MULTISPECIES: hypothetical protein [unclassified Pseudomonas]|uniref:hypothetical protein n=1 Tax=unclassified Pseudomonas TaxID=196821 RepID=UPI000CD1DCFC|nr:MULTISPECIES: hypothetical protein [unclassified Pseudomonas]POA25648.1 hypothetical protein C1895_09495 [Pseudomonas sp. FW305-3-2-15-E-TSA4]POA45043.1 hypothetical protein C1894_03465 [Pseudomonas sp. FW305-3-2-15-E-TSA2]